ncbi:MAG: hypothetical protein KJ077_35160 [Anaerolineae bacterium]|nr:hypothetical protein [Anaerolineae bacterium]
MSQTDINVLKEALKLHGSGQPGEKTKRYVGQFFKRTRLGTRISAQVVGNHGTYTVTVRVDEKGTTSACSCYIGKHGYCHHCAALALTFLNDPSSFREIKTKSLAAVQELAELTEYLQSVTLDSLLQELKAHGITQKAFAEGIGMNSRHLSAVKSSELRNHFYHELGATKLACLWVLERFGKANQGDQ